MTDAAQANIAIARVFKRVVPDHAMTGAHENGVPISGQKIIIVYQRGFATGNGRDLQVEQSPSRTTARTGTGQEPELGDLDVPACGLGDIQNSTGAIQVVVDGHPAFCCT